MLSQSGNYFLYIFVIDFSLEMLDLIHRIYEADESFRSLDFIVHSKLYLSHIVVQVVLGRVAPIVLLALTQMLTLGEVTRMRIYAVAGSLTLIGIFAMRWNVVIWGAAFLQEFFGIHDLPDGVGRAGRLAGCGRTHHSALRDTVAAGKVASTLAADRGSLPF